jgi:hypothetical protein
MQRIFLDIHSSGRRGFDARTTASAMFAFANSGMLHGLSATSEEPVMDRIHLLAAEIFGYSYANYEDHLGDEASVERLVTQICYRTADLAVLIEREGQPLSRYSRHLRREPGVEYGEGYFDE